MPNQHIIKARYPKGNIVFIFYDVASRNYSGHFLFDKAISKESQLKTIEETFPPTFDEVGEWKIKLLNERSLNIEFDYLKPDKNVTEYSFFDQLKSL